MQLLVEDVALDRPMVIQWEHQMTDDEYFQFCQINRKLRIDANRAHRTRRHPNYAARGV
jgi:hypothetical protein